VPIRSSRSASGSSESSGRRRLARTRVVPPIRRSAGRTRTESRHGYARRGQRADDATYRITRIGSQCSRPTVSDARAMPALVLLTVSSCRSWLVRALAYKGGLGTRRSRREGVARCIARGERRSTRGRIRADGRRLDAFGSTARSPPTATCFRFGPPHEIKRRLLTFWNSVRSSSTTRTIEGFTPSWDRWSRPGELSALDRWLVERNQAARRPTPQPANDATFPATLFGAFEAFVDDVSNW